MTWRGPAALVAIAAVGLGAAAGARDGDGTPAAAAAATSTAPVTRQDLVDRETLDGALGYADTGQLTAGLAGVLTRLPTAGRVARRGDALYELDGRETAYLLYGARPVWRDLAPGITDGEDVRQLERNLRALGHDPDGLVTVDGEWDAATTAAVRRFQDARGLTEDGTLSAGEVVFRRGATRIGEVEATLGQRVQPGAPVAEVSSTRRQVTVTLEASRQALARRSASVTVQLPDGRTVRGRIARVGAVARGGEEGEEPTIDVVVRLRGRRAGGTGLDQAPVTVGLTREVRRGVLTVPLTALLARTGGGYAVEVADGGRRRLLPVEPGLYADDRVEVEGEGLRAGVRVVVPA